MAADLPQDPSTTLVRPHSAPRADAAAIAILFPPEQIVGIGYFPNELGLPVPPPPHAIDPRGHG